MYIFLQYKLSESSNLKELSSEFEHNPNVLRYLNIKIDKLGVQDTFALGAETEFLFKKYGISVDAILQLYDNMTKKEL